MGTLKLRNLDLIHDKRESLDYTMSNESTKVIFKSKGYKRTVNVDDDDIYHFGCCTSTAQRKIKEDETSEFAFVKIDINRFPSKYRSKELIEEWLNFINETFPFCKTKLVIYLDGKTLDSEYWKEQNIRFKLTGKDYILISYEKEFIKDCSTNYANLAVLSFIRCFTNNEYYFMIYDCLRLRKLKSLKNLNNWKIMNIAKFGVQTNIQHHGRITLKSPDSSIGHYGFLRDYRFPLYMTYIPKVASTLDEFVEKLSRGNSQNSSSTKEIYIKLNVIYLMKLFEEGQYIKLHKLINNRKYHVAPSVITSNYLSKIYPNHQSNFHFLNINNLEFNKKEYEKTI